mmetsp:Transcript_9682/g.12200  ORF Transcript_9682/g.12200 Transcript_9682/m.12200 type:complete len:238 (+) Transcript_9682:2-715(+)
MGSKYDYIMRKALTVLKEYPGYKLDVTGLSLGGALCQVFSMYAAAETDPIIKKPVTCYSFASPKIGALTYRRAIQALEESGNLRLIRIVNEGDPIVALPTDPLSVCGLNGIALASLVLRQGLFYRKAGMEMKLLDDGGIDITHPKVPPRIVNWDLVNFNLLRYDVERLWQKQIYCCECVYDVATKQFDKDDLMTKHAYPRYYDKLKAKKREIEKYYLADLYRASLNGESAVVKDVYF